MEREQSRSHQSRREQLNAVMADSPWSHRIFMRPALGLRSILFRMMSWLRGDPAETVFLVDAIRHAGNVGLLPHVTQNAKGKLSIRFNDGFLNGTSIILRKSGSDARVFSQVIGHAEYAPLIKLIRQQARESIQYIVDAGANIGLTSIYFARHFPDAQIAAIEPDTSNFNGLCENIAINELRSVKPIKAGIWPTSARLELDHSFRDGQEWSTSLIEPKDDVESNKVDGLPLSAIKRMAGFPRVDILKLDIEGGERYLFSDDQTASELLDGIRFIAIEIHDEFACRATIEKLLVKNGFLFFEVGETVFAFRSVGASS